MVPTSVHVCVLGTEVPPLEAVDRAQVALLPVRKAALIQEVPGTIGVPDLHPLPRQLLGVGGPLDHNTESLRPASTQNRYNPPPPPQSRYDPPPHRTVTTRLHTEPLRPASTQNRYNPPPHRTITTRLHTEPLQPTSTSTQNRYDPPPQQGQQGLLTLMNHKSSSRIAFQNTFLVVSRGNWSGHKETLRVMTLCCRVTLQ